MAKPKYLHLHLPVYAPQTTTFDLLEIIGVNGHFQETQDLKAANIAR
jgi:hypothetical protein